MNTKTFAQQARQILRKGVATRLRYWGFDEKGKITDMPDAIGGGVMFRGEVFDDPTLIQRWESLRRAVLLKGRDSVLEEAAYTWFNRIMAMRILAKNGYEPAQLDYAEGGQQLPLLLQRARRGTHPFLNAEEAARLQRIINDFSRETEAFAILLIGYCHAHPLLHRVFGSIDDHTELLLPDNMLADDGFLHLLNTTDAISDEQHKEVELIGWLYQFYISEKKDEVFADFKKAKKAEAKDIPAATQIFTPNWIVKYMVENTVGKLWLDLHPDSPLKADMKYLVEGGATDSKLETQNSKLITEAAGLKLLDPAAGSGHILVEGFDLLYRMYRAEYYTPEEAVESILRHNLYGLDIDKRAAQLARFAVLLKAAKAYPDVLKKDWLPQVHAMPEPRDFSRQEVLDFLGKDNAVLEPVLSNALKLMQQAQNLGSIMQFDLGDWDLKEDAVLNFFIEKKAVKKEFYTKIADLLTDLDALRQKIKWWGDWDFPKSKLLKLAKDKNLALLLDLLDDVSRQADAVGLTLHLSQYDVAAHEVEDLQTLAEEDQKELLRKLKRRSSDVKAVAEKLEKWLAAQHSDTEQMTAALAAPTPALEKSSLQLIAYSSALRRHLTFDLAAFTLEAIEKRWQYLQTAPNLGFHEQAVLPTMAGYIPVLLTLCRRYEAVVANPPYMGQGNMNSDLKNYINKHYPGSKSDLMTVFMEVGIEKLFKNGQMGMINLPSWMFLASFQELREKLLKNNHITSLIHNGRGVFGSDFGSVSFCLEKSQTENRKGVYRRLFKEHVKVDSISVKEKHFLNNKYGHFISDQSDFSKIPGSPIAYWVSKNVIALFEETSIGQDSFSSPGIRTGQDTIFIRDWHEVNNRIFNPTATEYDSIKDTSNKWYPITRGGDYRKWFGNYENIINLKNEAEEIKNICTDYRLREPAYYFKGGVTWTMISSSKPSFRKVPVGVLYGNGGPVVFSKNDYYLVGLLNSKVSLEILKLLNPTINYTKSDIEKIPLLNFDKEIVEKHSRECVNISKSDWDAHETSWDFQTSPLLNGQPNLPAAYEAWEQAASRDFFQLHANEEELNRLFIGIYGLEEELTPDVPLKDITILQEELDGKALEALEPAFRERGTEGVSLPIKRELVMQQFISWAMSVFMGRYRLGQPGLHIAHPSPTAEEVQSYSYNGHQVVIDEDAIIPLMGSACDFPDDAVYRFKEFLDILWGQERRTENLNFLQDCLDMDLEKYLVKNFWPDHCKRYKKKPIYWLFSSPKGAFQVLVYMHRMNAFTVEKIRAHYLMPHLKNLRSKVAQMDAMTSSLSSQDARHLDRLRKDLQECEEYDLVLKDVADRQIVFDLDDGVSVNYEKFEEVVAKVK